MEEDFKKIMEAAQKDRSILRHLKNVAVRAQSYELASKLRDMERAIESSDPSILEASERARKVKTVLGIAGYEVDEPAAFIIDEAIKLWDKSQDISIADVATIKKRCQSLLG